MTASSSASTSSSSSSSSLEKQVLVTVGTTRFDDLVRTVLSGDVQRELVRQGFTRIVLQQGQYPPAEEAEQDERELLLPLFRYSFKPCLSDDICRSSLVISHAGAGTCTEVLSAGKPLVVVVNDRLMHNHQVELADQLASDGHLRHCVCQTLADTLKRHTVDGDRLKPFPPGNPAALASFLDREMDNFFQGGPRVESEKQRGGGGGGGGVNTKDMALAKSVQSAWLNILSSLLLRVLTFVVNAFVLRRVSQDTLGVNVRMVLLFDTIIFLSREAFRKSCSSRPKDKQSWRGIINLIWLSTPIAISCSLFLGYIWTNHLELPTEHVDQYSVAVKLYCLSALIVILSEPFYIVGQICLFVKFRSAVDLIWLSLSLFLYTAGVAYDPQRAVLFGALGSLIASGVFFLLHIVYFWHKLSSQASKKKEDNGQVEQLPFSSIVDFLPDLPSTFHIDAARGKLSVSFFKQGFLKQLLTEGEKYVFTWFSLMPLSQQGVYDVVANLGSIPARLLFVRMEESAHLYFSQTVCRGPDADMAKEAAPSRHLHLLLKGLMLLGMLVCAFGMSFCHLLLHLYGGDILSAGAGPMLLRAHCFYVMFLAINGVSECYAFAVMSAEQVSRYNHLLAVMTLVFLACSWLLAKAFGPVGFVVANCANFSMRIAHNFLVIARRHARVSVGDQPLRGLAPTRITCLALAAAASVCCLSERFLYGPSLWDALSHLAMGGVCFLATLGVIARNEPIVRTFLERQIRKGKAE